MPQKEVVPALGLDSFSCPHCGALAHQYWFKVYFESFTGANKPAVLPAADVKKFNPAKEENDQKRRRLTDFIRRFGRNEVTAWYHEYLSPHQEMVNLWFCRCHSCESYSVWIKESLVWPTSKSVIQPHEDMPPDVKEDFEEAAKIVEFSPRGAAALLRLALQKLMVDLGEKGGNINEDIASLVSKGLEQDIQRALDVVRVVGNNAVHPGQIDLKDSKATAIALFALVNLVVDRRISAVKRLEEMYNALPPGALEQIERRDGGKFSETK